MGHTSICIWKIITLEKNIKAILNLKQYLYFYYILIKFVVKF